MFRWKNRPEGSNWGEFGPDDELGRLNFISQKELLSAAREIKAGRSFCLSLPLDLPGGNLLNRNRNPPRLSPVNSDSGPRFNYPLRNESPGALDVVSDDQALLSLQYSTQWDALAHVGALFDADGDGIPELCYYNGYRAGVDVIGPTDARYVSADCQACSNSAALKLGIENLAQKAIQGRGVLIDLLKYFGPDRTLVGLNQLVHVIDTEGIVIEKGDLLVLHTGYAQAILDMAGRLTTNVLNAYGAVLDGRDDALLEWITNSGISAICADNYAVEAVPARKIHGPSSFLPLHHHCLFKLGLPLGELWYLSELARWLDENDRHHFMLTAPPLRLPHAVGSPVTPVATV